MSVEIDSAWLIIKLSASVNKIYRMKVITFPLNSDSGQSETDQTTDQKSSGHRSEQL